MKETTDVYLRRRGQDGREPGWWHVLALGGAPAADAEAIAANLAEVVYHLAGGVREDSPHNPVIEYLVKSRGAAGAVTGAVSGAPHDRDFAGAPE